MIYVDGYYPKPLYDAIVDTHGKQDTVTPSLWLSQPRLSADNTKEIIKYSFSKPASLSAIDIEVLQANTHVEIFYTNRDNKRLPLLQTSRQAISFDTVFSEANMNLLPSIGDSQQIIGELTWGRYSYECYPVIVTSIEIVLSRIHADSNPHVPYPLGLKEVLLKRSIATRKDASSPIPDSIDSLGNQVSHTISDWTPDKAIDDSKESYWKSEPQPSPDAVTALYLDVRDENGDPQWIDHFFVDPVTAGQQMNVYWSNDDTVGPNLPSESALAPATSNATYDDGLIMGTGSKVEFDSNLISSSHSHWVGLQWTPMFNSSANRLCVLWQWGNMSLAYDSQKLLLTCGTQVRELAFPSFTSGKKTFNIAFALNMLDAPYQGMYLAFCENGKTNITASNGLGIPVVNENSNRSFTVNGQSQPLSKYFSLLDNTLTPVPGAFSVGDTATLTLDSLSTSTVAKRLAFKTETDNKWGGCISEVPASSTIVTRSASGTINTTKIPHTNEQLSPNTLLDENAASLGPISGRAPIGNAVLLGTNPTYFDMQAYITGSKNERFFCTYLAKPIYGQGFPVPLLSAGTNETSTPSLVESLADGWGRYSCTITLTANLAAAKLGFQMQAFDGEAQCLFASPSVVREKQLPNQTVVTLPTTAVESVDIVYNHGPGTLSISLPTIVTTPAVPAFTPTGKPMLGSSSGKLTALIVKQTPATDMQEFLLGPETYVLPDPSPDSKYSSLANAVIVGRLSFENVFRGGVDGSKFTSKVWTPVFEDWTVSRRWFYLPYAINMKYLKLEFTNLVLEPYPLWEDDVDVSYQVFPVSVTETSKHLATLDTTKKDTTVTTDTSRRTETTTNNKLTSTQALHDRTVTQNSSSSTELSEIDLPREFDVTVGNRITTNFPSSSNIVLEKEFRQETANSAIYKGSETTSVSDTTVKSESRQVARKVTKTWTETVVTPTTKWVAQDIYYTVKPGDYLLKIAQKLGIPDWRVIYAYNIWLQSDYRVAMLPSRPAGWWIFPGQVFRIPGAVMKQVTTYTTSKVTRSSTETVYDTVVDTTTTTVDTVTKVDTSIDREETLSTTRNRFRDTSVHRYDIKTVKRSEQYAYFAAIRDIVVAKTNWLVERDTRLFDFVDYEADGWTLTGIVKEGSLYRPDGTKTTGQLISPVYNTISPFRTIKLLGSQRDSLLRHTPVPNIHGYSPTPEPSTSAWSSSDTKWKDTITPWGSYYSKPFSPLTVTPSGTNLIVTGGTGTDNASFIASSWSAKNGDTIGGRMIITPATVSSNVTLELRLIDMDSKETLAMWTGKESILFADQQNIVDWPLWVATRDVENVAMVAILLDKGAMNWTIGNPVHSTGTFRIRARNSTTATFEDVTHALGNPASQYTFLERGNSLEIRIEMSDRADWTSRLQVIPLYLTDDLRA